ncbi:MAG: sigma 54-interacting transcriptional regulator [Desulfobacterota bacterium]|nr:sigma 54-interacting transcriptional regulator [Thermodesulfobacteriota bacterium]
MHVIEKNIEYLPVIYLTDSMKALYQQGKKIASSDHAAILISGEQGTGKELLAKSIHYTLSPNAQFLTVNCVNLPFKHFEEKIETCFAMLRENGVQEGEHGVRKRPTLFLRDINKLETSVQKNLASLLQERVMEYATADPSPAGNIRLIFSAHQPADETHHVVDKAVLKTFNPMLLSILPLRDRKDDIYPLALFFVDKFSKEYGKDIGGIHSNAVQVLEAYPWNGNVSELRDVIENAVILAQTPLITKEDIRFNISKKSIALESFLAREDFFTLEELERIYIQTVCRRVKNNKSKAAKILGISRNTLQKKIELFAASHAKNHKKEKKRKNGNQPLLF